MSCYRLIGILLIFIVQYGLSNEDVCDRRPLGIKTDPLRPDNQFVLEIDDTKGDKYIPGLSYKVRLRSRDGKATFIAFTISLKEDTMENPLNPRKPIHLNPGRLEPSPDSTATKSSLKCNNTIVESDVTAKTSVEAVWTAPSKDNKCVSIFAVLAVRPNVWYSFEKPLSKRICEDPRKSDDMPPMEIDGDCHVCEDARYQLTFEGLWSYNTHSTMFPPTQLPRFSDVVGASHSPETNLFKFASEATEGIQMLAEQGNTTQFEVEIQRKSTPGYSATTTFSFPHHSFSSNFTHNYQLQKVISLMTEDMTELPKSVRTVIKATSPEQTNMSTVTSFRATREHHRLSIAAGIMPSPDWFLGVSSLELCNDQSKWADSIRLNLYPIDAGTDKGSHFEASNEEQSPPQPISPAVIKTEKDKMSGKAQNEEMKPFARLLLTRVRTYTTPDCVTEPAITEEQGGEDAGEGENEINEGEVSNEREESSEVRPSYATPRTTTTEEPPLVVDPDSSERCPMTNWDEWGPCEGSCENGTLIGMQIRFRYHIVDGAVIKFIDSGSPVSQYCLDNYSDMEPQPCVDTCNDNEEEAEDEDGESEASR